MKAEHVREARKALGLSREAFGKMLYLSFFAVRYWEEGTKAMQEPTFVLLRAIFHVPALRKHLQLQIPDDRFVWKPAWDEK